MVTITDIYGYEILDSRGNPTTAAKVTLSDGTVSRAYVPSGASTGIHEALELRDKDKNRFHGKGVLKAVENINTKIKTSLLGVDPFNQNKVDQIMLDLDGTPNKEVLGSNAILAVSLAVARAGSDSKKVTLYNYLYDLYQEYEETTLIIPEPGFNVLNGGAHADSGLDIQEFMLMPQLGSIKENVRAGSEIYHALKDLLSKEGYTVSVGDEGGFAPQLPNNKEALVLLKQAIENSGYYLGKNILLALDVAATEFYNKEKDVYTLGGSEKKPQDLIDMYLEWIKDYSIISIEDPFSEDDFDSWNKFMTQLPERVRVVGDDLLVTNVKRINLSIEKNLCNAVLIKPNQIGSLTETMQAIALSHKNGMSTMISHRSGDTSDDFIADLGVATRCEYIKSGALSRSERTTKYNRLIEIEQELSL